MLTNFQKQARENAKKKKQVADRSRLIPWSGRSGVGWAKCGNVLRHSASEWHQLAAWRWEADPGGFVAVSDFNTDDLGVVAQLLHQSLVTLQERNFVLK